VKTEKGKTKEHGNILIPSHPSSQYSTHRERKRENDGGCRNSGTDKESLSLPPHTPLTVVLLFQVGKHGRRCVLYAVYG
jgi:hypothetical protein